MSAWSGSDLCIKCWEINVGCQDGACLHWFLLLIPDILDITHTDQTRSPTQPNLITARISANDFYQIQLSENRNEKIDDSLVLTGETKGRVQ